LLVSDAADPLLARWQYGLGRAVAWTSDLRGRWSQEWLQWPGTAQLFSAIVTWTIAPAQGPLRVTVRADAEAGHISVQEATPGTAPAHVQAHVTSPDNSATTVDVPATGPGEYGTSFPLNGPGTYIVRVAEDGVGEAEAGLPVSYPAEFRQVTADPRRMQQIASAGGGRVLYAPADAFGGDLAPVTTPLPLQRWLLLAAAVLLPIEVGLRRLRLSPRDLWGWLRHPRRVALAMPLWRPGVGTDAPAWVPGMWKARPAPPPAVWTARKTDSAVGAHASPGLARDSTTGAETDEEDALGSAMKWLAARRGTTADRG
jgi:hypothetical protein